MYKRQGIPGTNGENGKTSYLHIKYSDDGKTFTANNGETPGVYMGVYAVSYTHLKLLKNECSNIKANSPNQQSRKGGFAERIRAMEQEREDMRKGPVSYTHLVV